MGKKRLLGLVMICAVIGVVAWEVFRPHEPMYEGKPLSHWLANYLPENSNETSQQQADHALQAIGTNALPYLISLLQKNDSAWELRLDALLQRQRLIPYHRLGARERSAEAAGGLQALRSDARFAAPALVELLHTNNPRFSRVIAASALCNLGPAASNAVPLLAESARKAAPNSGAQSLYLLIIRDIDPEAAARLKKELGATR